MPKIPSITSDEDLVLWQRVVSKVKPLKSKIRSSKAPTFFVESSEQEVTLSKPSNLTSNKIGDVTKTSYSLMTKKRALLSQRPCPVDLRRGDRAGIDGKTQKRLFRGEVLLDRRIDLHGLTAANAESRLKYFVETAAYDGCRCLLVITGKGEGVLRRHVPNWLKQKPLSLYILALAEARPKDGGGGALYVLLRRKRNG